MNSVGQSSALLLHVNQAVLRKNTATGERNPPIIVRRKSKSVQPTYCHTADLMVDGHKIGSLVYQPDQPLSCGARLWLELDPEKVEVVQHVWEKSNEQ